MRRPIRPLAAFSLTKRVPKRLTGSFTLRVEDLALLPSMESDLRTAIGAKMADVTGLAGDRRIRSGCEPFRADPPGHNRRGGRGRGNLPDWGCPVRRGRGRQAQPTDFSVICAP